MKIGFIGGGHIAKTIGASLVNLGHEVMISSRTPQQPTLQEWQQTDGKGVKIGTFSEAAEYGDLIIVAIKWVGLLSTLKGIDPSLLRAKTVIDCTNPTRLNTDTNTGELLVTDDSAGEIVQRLLPESHVVKALTDGRIFPQSSEGTPMMPIAGNSTEAKVQATALLRELGWEFVADLGGIRESRPIESLSTLMMDYVFQTGNFKAMFTILRQ